MATAALLLGACGDDDGNDLGAGSTPAPDSGQADTDGGADDGADDSHADDSEAGDAGGSDAAPSGSTPEGTVSVTVRDQTYTAEIGQCYFEDGGVWFSSSVGEIAGGLSIIGAYGYPGEDDELVLLVDHGQTANWYSDALRDTEIDADARTARGTAGFFDDRAESDGGTGGIAPGSFVLNGGSSCITVG